MASALEVIPKNKIPEKSQETKILALLMMEEYSCRKVINP